MGDWQTVVAAVREVAHPGCLAPAIQEALTVVTLHKVLVFLTERLQPLDFAL